MRRRKRLLPNAARKTATARGQPSVRAGVRRAAGTQRKPRSRLAPQVTAWMARMVLRLLLRRNIGATSPPKSKDSDTGCISTRSRTALRSLCGGAVAIINFSKYTNDPISWSLGSRVWATDEAMVTEEKCTRRDSTILGVVPLVSCRCCGPIALLAPRVVLRATRRVATWCSYDGLAAHHGTIPRIVGYSPQSCLFLPSPHTVRR